MTSILKTLRCHVMKVICEVVEPGEVLSHLHRVRYNSCHRTTVPVSEPTPLRISLNLSLLNKRFLHDTPLNGIWTLFNFHKLGDIVILTL